VPVRQYDQLSDSARIFFEYLRPTYPLRVQYADGAVRSSRGDPPIRQNYMKEAEAGIPVAGLIRRIGITEQTFCRWKKQYAGLDSDQARQLKQLQEENERLKKIVAELSLDKAMLADVIKKKW
jgi:putative transposase